VRGHVADVLGKNKAHFYDRTKPAVEGQPDFTAVAAGSGYDLKKREPIASP